MKAENTESALDDTRSRLLRASLGVFSRRDFDAVGVREIVELADANIAAVSYHFGGKQGLYLATADFLAEQLRQRMDPILERVRHQATAAEPDIAADLLAELIRRLVRQLLIGGLGDDAAGFILREQLQPTAAFDILYEKLMQPMQQGYQRLVECLSVHSPGRNPRAAAMTTHALMGQVLAFRTARATLLRRLEQTALTERDVDEIAAHIVDLTLRALDAHPGGENP